MTDLRTAAQHALEALEALQGGCTDSNDGTVEAITVWCPEIIEALEAALAEPSVDDPHRDHWVAIAEAAQKIAASKECGLAEVKALCAALDRLTDAALAEPVQEPVAWMWEETAPRSSTGIGGIDRKLLFCRPADEPWKRNITPLYTAPPQRKPLTEEEIREMFFAELRALPSYPSAIEELPERLARAIERAHGITS